MEVSIENHNIGLGNFLSQGVCFKLYKDLVNFVRVSKFSQSIDHVLVFQ